MDVDVLIAGAGPAGLTAACGLAAAGLRVRVRDKAPHPAATSRANILHARGVEVLTRLGALGDLPAQALEPAGMTMHARGRALATMRFSPDPNEDTKALFISQATVEGWLRDRLAQLGVTVEWGHEVTAVTPDDAGVTVGFADDTTLRCGWLLGCDGAHSTVREAVGVGFPGVPVIEQFLLADVHADWDRPRDVSSGWFHRDGMLLAMPMRENGVDANLWRLMADVPPAGRRLTPAEIVDRLRQLLAERGGQTDIAVHDTVWTSVFRVQRRLVDDYRHGRVLLAGDAAHIHSPIGGQGMNTGMGDAENLAWKLALVHTGRAGTELLDSYTAERRPLAADVLRNTTANTKLLAGENLPTRLLRDWFIVPVMKLPAVQRQATRVASQLGVSYHAGPLGGRGGTPRPGDRVPDRACRTLDGAPTTLYAHLTPDWVLLGEPGQDVTVSSFADLARHHLADVTPLSADGPGAEVWLLRPDGHLGWRGTDPSQLRDWLERTLLAKATQ